MPNKIILSILLLASVLISCDKPKGDDLSGDYKIKGTLMLKDTLDGASEEVLLSDFIVMVKTDTSTTNFLFQVKTNSVGGFEIPNLSDKSYFLYSEKKINDILYATNLQIIPAMTDTYKMILYPTARDYNIFSVIAKDSSSQVTEILNNVSVCLFKSKRQSDGGNCDDAIWRGKTDKFGRAQTNRLAAGTYYINASLMLSNITLVAKDTVLIGATGIRQKQIFLKAGSVSSISGEVYLNDTLSGINEEVVLPGQILQVKKLEDANNQSFLQQVASSERGLFSFTGLPEGSYWLQSEKILKGVLFKSTAISKTGPYARMVLLPNATNYNILQIVAKDANGGLLKNAKICIFNTPQLAQNSMCDGALYTDVTDNNGRLLFVRLPAGKYYINAEFNAGNLILQVKDNVDLDATGIFQKQIILKP